MNERPSQTELLIQAAAAQMTLWASLVDVLVKMGVINAEDLVASLNIGVSKVQPDKDGPMYRAITSQAIKAVEHLGK